MANQKPDASDSGADATRPVTGPPNRARQSEKARLWAAALVNRRLAKGVHRPFLQSMHRFQGSMTTLRQIHEKLTPTVAKWPDEISQDFRRVIEPFSEEQRKSLLNFASEALPGLVRGTLVFRDLDEDSDSGGDDVDEEDKVANAWQLVAEQMDGDMGAAYELLHLLYMKSTTPELAQTFHRSLLVSAVAALDVLLLELISHFYFVHPGALGNETTFTLEELSKFSDLEGAKASAVEKKANRVLRKGVKSWMNWLDDQGVNLESHCSDFKKLIEVIQRRHVAVHNDGRVSRAYLENVRELSGESSPHEFGSFLKIDADYLSAALDELEAVGNLVAGAVWTKCLPEAKDVVNFEFYVRTYDLLLAERWRPTACICSFAKQSLSPDDDLYLIHKVNAWLARKRLGESIQDEARSWTTKTLNTRFQAAQAALLDDFDLLEQLVLKCLRAGDLALEDAWEWPLFAELRGQEHWQRVVDEFSSSGD